MSTIETLAEPSKPAKQAKTTHKSMLRKLCG